MMNGAITEQSLDLRKLRSKSFALRFVLSAGTTLAVTGVAKILSGFGNSKFLAVVDPIFGVTFGQLMLAVGAAEIVVALVCLFGRRQTLALGLVAWLSTNFLVYRLGLWWLDWKRPCNCLGNLTDAGTVPLLLRHVAQEGVRAPDLGLESADETKENAHGATD